jgi:hypothetical protein
MSGRASDSSALQGIRVSMAAVAVVGYVAFDWQFGGESGAVPTVLAILAVALAVGVTLSRRL